jgi:hypothetical protein
VGLSEVRKYNTQNGGRNMFIVSVFICVVALHFHALGPWGEIFCPVREAVLWGPVRNFSW